jgi:hypothetical protein
MSRSVAVLSVLTGVLAVAAAAPVPKEKPPLYFPTKKGATWVYDWDGRKFVEVVTATKMTEAGTVVTVGMEDDGKTIPVKTVRVSEKGLDEVASGTEATDPPMTLLRLPLRPGEKWAVDTKFKAGLVRGKWAAFGPEEVVVPAGKYQAIRVEAEYVTDAAPGARTHRTTFWYAPHVGLVKMADADTLKVLKKFTPGDG